MECAEELKDCSPKQHRSSALAAAWSDRADPRARAEHRITEPYRMWMHGGRAARCMQARSTRELLFKGKLCDAIDAEPMRRHRRKINLEGGVDHAALCKFNGRSQGICRKVRHGCFHHGRKPLKHSRRVPRDQRPKQHRGPARIEFSPLHGARSSLADHSRAGPPKQESQRRKRREVTALGLG